MKFLTEKNIHRAAWAIFILSLLYSFLAIFSGKIPSNLFFNGDSLFLPSLYKNLFEQGYEIATFKFPDAPFLFPDFILYILFEKIFHNFKFSNILMAQTFFIGIFISLYKLSTLIDTKKKTLMLTILSTFILLISNGTLFVHTVLLMSPVFHEGELLVVILLLILLLKNLKKETLLSQILFFLLLTGITFGDKSIIKDFTGPLLSLLPIIYFWKKDYFKPYLRLSSIAVIATLTGNLLYTKIISFTKQPVPTTQFQKNIESIVATVKEIFSQSTLTLNQHEFINITWAFLLFILVYFILGIRFLIKNFKKSEKSSAFYIFTLFLLSQSALNLFATVFFGYYQGLVHIRYFTTQLVFPVLWLALYFKNPPTRVTLVLAAIVLTYSLAGITYRELNAVFEYKPENVKCLDTLATKHNMRYGLAEFWQATPNTIFSNKNVTIHPIQENNGYIKPFHWLTTYKIFLNTDYTFVLDKDLPENLIVNTLGEPYLVEECPTTNVYIYDQTNLKNQFNALYAHGSLENIGDKIIIPAKDFNSYVFDRNILVGNTAPSIITENGKLESSSEPGLTAQGPALTLKKGGYKLSITYSANAENTGLINLLTTPPKSLASIKLANTNGQEKTVDMFFEVGKNIQEIKSNEYKTGLFKLEAIYSGKGKLILNEASIERIN